MSESVEKVDVPEEVVIGEQATKEYIEKVDFKKSAEVKMVLYVVPVAIVFIIAAYIINSLSR